MNEQQLKHIVEGALLAAGRSLNLDQLQELFLEDARPEKGQLRKVIDELGNDFAERSIEIRETASGFRIQVRQEFSEWVSRLWEERPTRYSRALLETLALVAYRQPITRGEIEDVRGVSVSTSIMRTLQERDWVRVVGHRDVPGRPAMYGTTKTFLDYFSLKSLDELPTLAELRDIDSINVELDLREHGNEDVPAGSAAKRNDDESDNEPHDDDAGDDEQGVGVAVASPDQDEEGTDNEQLTESDDFAADDSDDTRAAGTDDDAADTADSEDSDVSSQEDTVETGTKEDRRG